MCKIIFVYKHIYMYLFNFNYIYTHTSIASGTYEIALLKTIKFHLLEEEL